jgi:hypothetical protein
MRNSLTVLALISMAVQAAADGQEVVEQESIGEYQSIVDRQMFGKPPAGFDPMKMPSEVSKSAQKEVTKEQEKLQSSVHFSVINISDDGTPVVGFTDNADPKKPVHLYLRLGEERAGWLVKSADPKTATTTLVKGDIELNLTLGDNSASSGGGKNAPAAAGGQRRIGDPAGRPQTLLSRRALRRREAEAVRAKEDAERAEQAAVREAEMKEQREQINASLMAMREAMNRMREEKQREKDQAAAEGTDESNDAQ